MSDREPYRELNPLLGKRAKTLGISAKDFIPLASITFCAFLIGSLGVSLSITFPIWTVCAATWVILNAAGYEAFLAKFQKPPNYIRGCLPYVSLLKAFREKDRDSRIYQGKRTQKKLFR
jgi:hypothetical protein